MSSYDVKSKHRGGQEMQNLALQWGYQAHSPARKRFGWDKDSALGRNILNLLNPLIHAVLMLAGTATTLTAIAAVAWMNGLIVLEF